MKQGFSISLKWVGISFILGLAIKIIVDRIAYTAYYRLILNGRINAYTYSNNLVTIFSTTLLIINLAFVIILLMYFLKNNTFDDGFFSYKNGLIGSVAALIFLIYVSVLYISFQAKLYDYEYLPRLFNALIAFSFFFCASYVFIMACLWKIMKDKYAKSKIELIFSSSLIFQGICTLMLALNFIGQNPIHIGEIKQILTHYFFNSSFSSFYFLFTFLTGAVILLIMKEQKKSSQERVLQP